MAHKADRKAPRHPLDQAAKRLTRQAHRETWALACSQGGSAKSAWHCGAHARSTGEPCRRAGAGRGGRCRLHGGASRGVLPEAWREFMHDYFSSHGHRGAEVHWARVREAGGLDPWLRDFLRESGRKGARLRWARARRMERGRGSQGKP